MRIVQVSDLHFGNHNPELARALIDRMKSVKPNVIVATGDLADEPRSKLFDDARNFLNELASHCQEVPGEDAGRPKLILIPGNHDFLLSGIMPNLFGRFGG